MKKLLAANTLFIALLLFSEIAIGQTVYMDSAGWYDEGTNTVYGYVSMSMDYFAAYYYMASLTGSLSVDGYAVDWETVYGGTNLIVDVSAPGQQDKIFLVYGSVEVVAYFMYYDPYFYLIYWYDHGNYNYWGQMCSGLWFSECSGGGPPLWWEVAVFRAGEVGGQLPVPPPTVALIYTNGGKALTGTENTTQISASGTPVGGTYTWSTTSDKISLTNIHSSNVAVTGLSESAAGGSDVHVEVRYTKDGFPSGPAMVDLTVQKPRNMAYLSTSYIGPPREERSCPPNLPDGLEKVIDWQVVDRDGNAIIHAMPGSDTGDYSQTVNQLLLGTFRGSTDWTNSQGQWTHYYHYCTIDAVCPSGTRRTEGTQHFNINGASFDLPFTFRCDSITVNGH